MMIFFKKILHKKKIICQSLFKQIIFDFNYFFCDIYMINSFEAYKCFILTFFSKFRIIKFSAKVSVYNINAFPHLFMIQIILFDIIQNKF